MLGAHGRRGGGALSATAQLALHTSPVPVLIARPLPYRARFPGSLLLASDGSPAMEPSPA